MLNVHSVTSNIGLDVHSVTSNFHLQYVDLSDSGLSDAIKAFPKDELDFDPDWEIDPKDIKLMDKLGEPAPPSNEKRAE